METALGILSVLFFVSAAALAVAVLHRALRPARRDEGSISVALRDLEPKTGRQRFSVRLFEVALLSAAWSCGGVFLALWASVGAEKENDIATLAVAAIVVALLAATWWAWRRGSLSDVVGPPRGAP